MNREALCVSHRLFKANIVQIRVLFFCVINVVFTANNSVVLFFKSCYKIKLFVYIYYQKKLLKFKFCIDLKDSPNKATANSCMCSNIL